jgi:two-component system chemotaxis sensor kinase CheA
MGDGAVALTIDVLGIAGKAKLSNFVNVDQQGMALGSAQKISTYQADSCEYLLVEVGTTGSCGIPLAIVSRLEEFDRSRIELSGEQPVIRYRDSLLPIFSLPDYLKVSAVSTDADEPDHVRVVVIKRGDRLYGIQVTEILDVITIDSKLDQTIRDRAGILGTLIYQDRVIFIADILGMVDELRKKADVRSIAHGNSSDGRGSDRAKYTSAMRRQHKILVVEDSSFFRNYIRQVIEDAGFQCELACDGEDGIANLERHPSGFYSAVLSDIEMPVMDGLAFVRKIRATARIANLPVIAITTKFSPAEVNLGKQAGFNNYLEKLNAEVLLAELDAMVFPGKDLQEVKHGTVA